MTRDFKKIKVWQLADILVIEIYRVTKGFPKEELYGITSQLRRAAVSVPTNIAEGANREHVKEYLQFLNISKGSAAEVKYLLHLANQLEYLSPHEYEKLESMADEVARMLHGLIASVRKDLL